MLRWQLREWEQQELVEERWQAAMETADRSSSLNWEEFSFGLALTVLGVFPYINDQRLKSRLEPDAFFDIEWMGLFSRVISWLDWQKEDRGLVEKWLMNTLISFAKFSRTQEEIPYLLWRLFEKLGRSLSCYCAREYFGQQVFNQKLVYGGEATDRVPKKELDEKRLVMKKKRVPDKKAD